MTILISGANGFLGKHLTRHFAFLNFTFDTLGKSKINTIVADITNTISIPKPYNIVIHAAGKAHSIPKNEIERNKIFNINVIGTENLLKGLENSFIPERFIFISSVSVYGKVHGENINESAPLLAEDPYGKSKLEAEKIVKSWCDKHNVIYTILRLPLIVGVNPPGNLGFMIKGIEYGYYFNVAKGSAKKSMVLADDVAKFIMQASEVGGIFNLTDGYNPTLFELSNTISKQLGKSKPLNMPYLIAKIIALFGDLIGPLFPINSIKLNKITSNLTYDDSKARKYFGWEPKSVLKDFNINE